MAGISRKELKQNDFVAELSSSFDFVQQNKTALIIGALLVLVLAGGGWGGYTWYNNRADGAAEALGKALQTYHAPVRPVSLADAPNEITFTTDKLRADASLKLFQEVADKYGMMRSGKLAHYYMGLCQVDLGNLPAAEKELTDVMNGGDTFAAPLARLALAGVDIRATKPADAEQNLRYLVDHPSEAVPKLTAQLALAAYLGPRKPAEAEQIYKDIEASKPGMEIMQLIQKQRAEIAK